MKINSDRITPWSVEGAAEFYQFLINHLTKIIAIHSVNHNQTTRYVSKNNLNIARIDTLLRNIKDAVIVVPFRNPLQHAESLLKQHRNFLNIHSEDRFAWQYMEAIGHYDFGENLKPVNFGGWLDNSVVGLTGATSITFWLEYWLETYRQLLMKSRNSRFKLLSYEAFCGDPSTGLGRLNEVLDMNNPDSFFNQASEIKAVKLHDVSADDIDKDVLQQVNALYDELVEVSIV